MAMSFVLLGTISNYITIIAVQIWMLGKDGNPRPCRARWRLLLKNAMGSTKDLEPCWTLPIRQTASAQSSLMVRSSDTKPCLRVRSRLGHPCFHYVRQRAVIRSTKGLTAVVYKVWTDAPLKTGLLVCALPATKPSAKASVICSL
eukprot:6300169-Amphidinium_carterae.1